MPQDYEDNSDEEFEYSSQDILDICNKLYRDEFLSVFDAENLSDNKIDEGMKYIFDIMVTNKKFNEIIIEITHKLKEFYLKNEEVSNEKLDHLKQLIIMSLFSQNIFYITHKCICQHIESGTIDEELLIKLRKHSIDIINNQFV